MKRALLILPALAVGVAAFILLGRDGGGPEIVERREIARRVRVLEAPRVAVVPRAIGYGVAHPGRVWQAVAEVGGRIVMKEPRLKEGNILKAGTELIRIERKDYDLEVAQARSQIQSIAAQLTQLEAREKTVSASLEIEERSLALADAELERIRTLVGRKSATPADQEREERTYLSQLVRVQELRNTLALIEPDRRVLLAQEAVEKSRLTKAELNVERTVIRAPFDCRVGPVDVEQDQVVSKGQTLFAADGIDSSEVTAQIPLVGVRHLFAVGDFKIDIGAAPVESFLSMQLSATVRLQTGALQYEWNAEVTRVKGIDSQTRTLGIVVSVKDPYKGVRPGTEPPLVRGMYVEVEVRGRARPDSVVVPRSAIHSGRVYLVDTENRLESRPVEVAFVQSRFAVLRAGLEGGEAVVLSDVVPAAPGMLLDPEPDAPALAELRADAAGETRMR